MRLLLHAIAADKPPLELAAGVRQILPVRLDEAGLSAWATPLTDERDALGRADLLAHHAVVTDIDRSTRGCLPARFPTWVDEDGLRELLRTRQVGLRAGLERIVDRAELAVMAVWTCASEAATSDVEATTPGRRYLLERRQAFVVSDHRRARARELATDVEHLLGEELVEARHQECPSSWLALSSALLVPRARAAALKTRLSRVEHDVRILVNGPWPAYTFAVLG